MTLISRRFMYSLAHYLTPMSAAQTVLRGAAAYRLVGRDSAPGGGKSSLSLPQRPGQLLLLSSRERRSKAAGASSVQVENAGDTAPFPHTS
jgi:hypothetical protein